MARREDLYIQYERFKVRYLRIQRIYDSILSEKEEMFTRTQPKAITYDGDKVDVSHSGDALERYMEDLERSRISERLKAVKSILSDRGDLLRLKEEELRQSKTLNDKIYRMRYLEHRKIQNIAKVIGYSESQVYRLLQSIDERCEKMRKNL